MKKLIDFIKTKEKEKEFSASEKKADPKAKKAIATSAPEEVPSKPNDLFWDGYSDIGYC
ncbi:MAG: hypothetical protein R2788_18790 [Saprospiraceae bacterium]|jgi:hypothetical protein